MTDPDERIINRAIAYVGLPVTVDREGDDLQDLADEARAALHRLFRDRRRLEDEVTRLRESGRALLRTAHIEAFNHAMTQLIVLDEVLVEFRAALGREA